VTVPFRLEALHEARDRAALTCGDETLDRYFHTQVAQDIRRHVTNCFVAIEAATGLLTAFYTLAATSIPTPDLPREQIKRLPRYPTIPAVRIGRLAVDQRFRGRGLGAALLADAARRTLEAPPTTFALVVDAKNDQAIAFYEHHGFIPFASQPRTLFLPLGTAAKALLRPERK
jgi:ribosomal protein S18 acetylase RimI-like enzyme